MPTAERKRELSEITRRARDVYDRVVKPHQRPEDDGKFVALDPATGEYEIDADDYTAARRLRDRLPGVVSWLGRVNRPTTYRML